MDGKWIPGVSRQDLKKIKELPVPLFREWLINYSNEIQYQSAVAEKALILEALHREFGFGKVRLGRLLDRAEKIKKEVEHGQEHGQGKSSENR